jgi:hypothetical protein
LSKAALKPSPTTNAADAATPDGDNSSAVPPFVANANAQMTVTDTPAGNGRAMSARANDILQTTTDNPTDARPPAAQTQIVSADQLNDVDRALHETNPPAVPLAVASAEPPAASATTPVMAGSAASSSDSTWDRTSLIGKIFIGFGALLTMASAARMFMA